MGIWIGDQRITVSIYEISVKLISGAFYTQVFYLVMAVYCSNRLQRDVSADGLNGPTVQADISEDVRGLLTELIGDVVEAAESPTDSTTRKSSKRRASDVPLAEPEPSHKRRPFGIVVRRTAFNPVSEHHHWCPYICGIANDGSGDVGGCKPWLRLLRQLVPDAEAALSRVQTSPAPNGIDRIRKLFRAWTSTT